MNPVPKPPRTERKPRKPLPPSSGPIARGAKPRPVNVSATAKRNKRKAAKYSKFRRSAGYKEAKARANGQCEGTLELFMGVAVIIHCPATEGLQVHHKTYKNFGGDETADQLEVLCKSCHEAKHAGKKVA